MRNAVYRIAVGQDFARDLEVYDEEANPVPLAGYAARIRVDDVDGNSVVDSTSSPRVVIATKGLISYRALPADLTAAGAYRFRLDYTDASGVVRGGEQGELYVDGVL